MNYMQRNVFTKNDGPFATKKPDKPPIQKNNVFQENYKDMMTNFLSLSPTDRETHVHETAAQQGGSRPKETSFSKRKSSNQKYESSRCTTTLSSDEDASFIMALSEGRGYARCEVGIAAININSPHLILCQLSDNFWYSGTLTKLNILNAVEILVPNTYMTANGKSKLIKYIQTMYPNVKITPVPRRHFNESLGLDLIKKLCATSHQNVTLQIKEKFYTLASASALLNYLEFIKLIKFLPNTLKMEYQPKYGTMLIDVETSQRLELLYSLSHEKAPKSSLFGVLDYCVTAIGKRNLRAKILQPLCDIPLIKSSHCCVRELLENGEIRCNLNGILKQFSRVDKLLNLAVLIPQENNLKAAEIMINQALLLKSCLENIPKLYEILAQTEAPTFQNIRKCLEDPRYIYLLEKINSILSNSAGGQGSAQYFQRLYAVKPNINELLDASRKLYSDKVDEIREIIQQFSETSKLSLKMMHTLSRGFHMQMALTKKQIPPPFPESFEILSRNGFYAFITTPEITIMNGEIKEIIEMIQIASNIVVSELLMEFRQEIDAIYHLTGFIAELDIIQSLSIASQIGNYCEPTISESMKIKNGIHPLLEHNIDKTDCVPNNVIATPEYNFYFITGPNMGGKSIYLKMIAILQVMFQIGCFIPAKSAEFRICDKLFSRIGLGDSIEHEASSFMVEMREMEYIIKNITPNSLVIIDELCRSTNPEEGKILAWRICEKLIKMNGISNDGNYYKDGPGDKKDESTNNEAAHNLLNITSPFVFVATHFLELTKMNEQFYSVINLHLSAEQKMINDVVRLQYLHKVESGVTPISRYGLALARNVRFPCDVLPRAEEILTETISNTTTSNLDFENITFNTTRDSVKISQIERGLYDLSYNIVSVLRGEDTKANQLKQINTLLERFASTQNNEFVNLIQNRTYEEILNMTENATSNATGKIDNQSLTIGTSAADKDKKDNTTARTSDLSFHSLKRRIEALEAKQKKVCTSSISNDFENSEVFTIPDQIGLKPNFEDPKKQVKANPLVVFRKYKQIEIKQTNFGENFRLSGTSRNQTNLRCPTNQNLNFKSNLPRNCTFMHNKSTHSMFNKFLEGSNNSKSQFVSNSLTKAVHQDLANESCYTKETGFPEICILTPGVNTDLENSLKSSQVISLSSAENRQPLSLESFFNVSELGNSQIRPSNRSRKGELSYQTELYLKNIFHNEMKKHSTYKTSKTKDNRILKEKEAKCLPIENTPKNAFGGNPISSFFSNRSSSTIPNSTITSSSMDNQSLILPCFTLNDTARKSAPLTNVTSSNPRKSHQNFITPPEVMGPPSSNQSTNSCSTTVSKPSKQGSMTSINLFKTLPESMKPSGRRVSFTLDDPMNDVLPTEKSQNSSNHISNFVSKRSTYIEPSSTITSGSLMNHDFSDILSFSSNKGSSKSAKFRYTTSKSPLRSISQPYVQGPISSITIEKTLTYNSKEQSQRTNENSAGQELFSTSALGASYTIDSEMMEVNIATNDDRSASSIGNTDELFESSSNSICPPGNFIIPSTNTESNLKENVNFDGESISSCIF